MSCSHMLSVVLAVHYSGRGREPRVREKRSQTFSPFQLFLSIKYSQNHSTVYHFVRQGHINDDISILKNEWLLAELLDIYLLLKLCAPKDCILPSTSYVMIYSSFYSSFKMLSSLIETFPSPLRLPISHATLLLFFAIGPLYLFHLLPLSS